nr:hypothetical protein BgiMline_005096 [Biomphalaria glabrata]
MSDLVVIRSFSRTVQALHGDDIASSPTRPPFLFSKDAREHKSVVYSLVAYGCHMTTCLDAAAARTKKTILPSDPMCVSLSCLPAGVLSVGLMTSN